MSVVIKDNEVFTVLIQYKDGTEKLVASSAEIDYERTDVGGLLAIGDEEYELVKGDNVFVMNASGQTVRRYNLR